MADDKTANKLMSSIAAVKDSDAAAKTSKTPAKKATAKKSQKKSQKKLLKRRCQHCLHAVYGLIEI
jgi:cytochrome c5